MCQLFALNCNSPTAITFSFTGLSARGGHTGPHADGFGVVFHDPQSCRQFIDDGRAADSALADFLRTHPIRARTVLGHVRKATQGEVELSNCHPFVREWQGRHWSFSHNGDLRGFQPRLSGSPQPVGRTDSERAFCWILQGLRRRFRSPRPVGWKVLAPAIAELAEEIAAFGSFNFTMSNGEVLFAHASTSLYWLRREHPFAEAHLVDRDLRLDLSIANRSGDRMALVATEPLTRNEPWVAFETGEMRVFEHGVPVWQHRSARARSTASTATGALIAG